MPVSLILPVGKKQYLLSFLLGASATLALPPFYIFPLLIPAFCGLLLLLQRNNTWKESFITGWWFGFGHFVFGLYWIANSLLVDAKMFAWLIPFAVSGIPAVLAIYIGIVCSITFFYKEKGFKKALFFSSIWVTAEYLRGILFTGFPWNLIGYSFGFSLPILQLTSVTGIYGLSFLAVLFATSFICLIEEKNKKFILSINHKTYILPATILIFIIFAGICGYVRISEPITTGEKVSAYIVQGNIPQQIKWDPEYTTKEVVTYKMLTEKALKELPPAGTAIIVWPESAITYSLDKEPALQQFITENLPPKTFLITGAIRSERNNEKMDIWNSVYVLTAAQKIISFYDKSHLVPFGEYVPFRKFIPFVKKITYGSQDFSEGVGLKTISLTKNLRISPLVCYEIIFPGKVTGKDANVIVNVTNDAWFGYSPGPFQHRDAARLRAIEEGVTVIRVANTGISEVFDQYGHSLARIPLNQQGVKRVDFMPDIIYTTYGRYEDAPLLLLIGIIVIFLVFFTRRRKNT